MLERPLVLAVVPLALLSCGPAMGPEETAAATLLEQGFDAGALNGWAVAGREDEDWRVEGGRLGLRTPSAGIFGEDTYESTGSATVELGDLEPPFCVEVDLEVYPEHLYENAGLIFLADRDNYTVVTFESYVGHHDPPTIVRVFTELDGELIDDHVAGLAPAGPLRFRAWVDRDSVTGSYRRPSDDAWTEIGSSRHPPGGYKAIGVQTGYGDEQVERWAYFDDFVVTARCD